MDFLGHTFWNGICRTGFMEWDFCNVISKIRILKHEIYFETRFLEYDFWNKVFRMCIKRFGINISKWVLLFKIYEMCSKNKFPERAFFCNTFFLLLLLQLQWFSTVIESILVFLLVCAAAINDEVQKPKD